MRIQKIIKHGNALAVVIPVQYARQLDWKRGDYVEMIAGLAGIGKHGKREQGIAIWKVLQKKSH